MYERYFKGKGTENAIDDEGLTLRVLILGSRIAEIIARLCPAGICRGDHLVWLNTVNMRLRKALKSLQKTRTISEYVTGMSESGVAGKVGCVLGAAGAGVVWPATSVKEARATKAERAEWAMMATN
jgi:hypothetical protein